MVQKNSGNEKIINYEGENHNFLSKICCLQFSENPFMETFCVLECCGYRTRLGIRSGEKV